jgi:hypothetical protein
VRFVAKSAGRLVRRRIAFRLLRFVREGLNGPLFDLPSGLRFLHVIAFLDFAGQYLDIAFDLLLRIYVLL